MKPLRAMIPLMAANIVILVNDPMSRTDVIIQVTPLADLVR